MIDLTPLDVRKKRGDFRRQLRGYDPEEVDTFMDLVADRFEELVRENLSLNEKTGRLEAQLKALEGRESAVQEALVTAQKLRVEVRDQSQKDAEVLHDQASRTAELLKAEANAEINRRLGEAEGLIRERQRAMEELERNRLKFLKSFRSLLEREIDAVDVEESRRPLDDTPLELEFRGWTPDGEMDEEGESEPDAGLLSSLVVSAEEINAEEEVEVVEDLEIPEALEEEEAVLMDPSPESDDPGPEEAGDEEIGGFETQILEVAPPEPIAEPTHSPPQEPKWLFSLLKKKEDEGEGQG
jgi:cell division initiation protein